MVVLKLHLDTPPPLPPPPHIAALAVVVGCNDTDQFIHHYYHRQHHPHHQTLPLAFVSPPVSFIDIGARSSFAHSLCNHSRPARACTSAPEQPVEPDAVDLNVTCEGTGSDNPKAQETGDVFTGVVLLQLLHIPAAADGNDLEGRFRDVQAAASSLKMAEALGLVTSLAGV